GRHHHRVGRSPSLGRTRDGAADRTPPPGRSRLGQAVRRAGRIAAGGDPSPTGRPGRRSHQARGGAALPPDAAESGRHVGYDRGNRDPRGEPLATGRARGRRRRPTGRPAAGCSSRPRGGRDDVVALLILPVEVRLVPGRHRLEATLSEVAGPSTRNDAPVPLQPWLSTDVDVEWGRVLLLE